MKKFLNKLFICFLVLIFNNRVFADYYINLNDFSYSKDNKSYSDIVSYDSVSEFEKAKSGEVYLTTFLYDGVSSYKIRDLDDYIEKDSNDVEVKELNINVININGIGDYYLTGTTKGTMIAINTNDLKGDINIILNGVNIDTDTKKAPAIYVYNKDKTYSDVKVTIKTLDGTNNYVTGGQLKKVSLLPSEKLSEYKSLYNGDALENYEKYTSYYGVYTSKEIENILFAVVEADSEDLADGDPKYSYKASGAISSDIDLYFEGVGNLKVTSNKKEGIETKGNMEFLGGKGNYEVYAFDDALNTTTASGDNIRNDLVINVESLLCVVDAEADEGDAIDSNGKLTINGGKIYAFAHPTSADSGLDSGNGTIINGGTIISTGNMSDSISSESKQKYIYVNFNDKIDANTLIVIKDQNNEIISAFKTSRTISNLFYSDESLDYESFKIYTGGEITGSETNGLYSDITNYVNGDEIEYSTVNNMMNNKTNISTFLLRLLLIEIGLLVIVILVYIFILKGKKNVEVKTVDANLTEQNTDNNNK